MPQPAPTNHSMNRRSTTHDYSLPGIYHITIRVEKSLHQPLGHVTGSLDAPDGTPDAPHVELTPVGEMVRHELQHGITAHYPMLAVQDYIIMPEHLHFLLVVQDKILSRNGKTLPVGQAIAGFKLGCNRHYWQLLQLPHPAALQQQAEPVATRTAVTGTPAPAGSAASGPAAAGSAAPSTAPSAVRVPSGLAAGSAASGPAAAGPAATGTAAVAAPTLPSLFAPGYCDVIPVTPEQLAQQRDYIRKNPRSRLLRTSNRAWLQPRRGGIDTALTPAALRGYLQRECPAGIATADALSLIEHRLLLADGKITCDSYGNRALLADHRLLPVVCHRKDAALLSAQKARSLQEAAAGAVLVSPRISKNEQDIIDAAIHDGYPVILIADNGLPQIYHPSQERLNRCAEGLQLIVTPWQYQYRPRQEAITVLFCKAMNCVAQALCRLRDDWWKT